MIPQLVNLPKVSYLGKSIKNPPKHDSPVYDTPSSQSPLGNGMIPPGESLFLTLKLEYLSEISTKIENILTNWSVTQTGSNEEKNWRVKISLDCPFNRVSRIANYHEK